MAIVRDLNYFNGRLGDFVSNSSFCALKPEFLLRATLVTRKLTINFQIKQ